jgi:hypothetical protein
MWHVNDSGIIVAEYGGHTGFFDYFWQMENWIEAINSQYEYEDENNKEINLPNESWPCNPSN